MKAEQAFNLSTEAISKEQERVEQERQARIDSGIYNHIFQIIAEEAKKGNFEVIISPRHTNIFKDHVFLNTISQEEKNFVQDLRFLGYRIDRGSSGRSVKISWSDSKIKTTPKEDRG